jgi:hypothetical protein
MMQIAYLLVRIVATHQAVEEEVVVVRHGCVVKHRRHLWATGVLDQQFSRFRIGIDGVCKLSPVRFNYQPSPESPASNSKLTLCQKIELVNEKTLILRPREIKRLGRQHLWNTVFLEIVIVNKLGNPVQCPSLEAWEGGDGFLDDSEIRDERSHWQRKESLPESERRQHAGNTAAGAVG